MNSKITIAKPCHQNWNKMTAEQQGRHCSVCSKVVKDFTKMKTEEIVNSLKSTDGEVCGRININQLTATNKKQQFYFWINGVLFRKAIYPIMALLGITLVSKKAVAQINHYRLKGKVAYNGYHTSAKKITLIVKTAYGNNAVPNAKINILSGLINHSEELFTDGNGRVSLNVEAKDLIGDVVEIGITAPGYEYKQSKIKIIKDIQTIEIKMEEEMMIMGEMMMMPKDKESGINKVTEIDSVEQIPITKSNIERLRFLQETNQELFVAEFCRLGGCIIGDGSIYNAEVQEDKNTSSDTLIENVIIERDPVEKCQVPINNSDSLEKIQIIECRLLAIQNLPEITEDINSMSETIIDQEISKSSFNIFPVPSFDHVNIVSGNDENFNVDVLDNNGKKIHTFVNNNSRYTLDVSNYSAGVYYVLLSINGKAVESKKILVSR